MKTYLSLIIITILLSFSTAYFALDLQKNIPSATDDDIQEIKNVEQDFQKKFNPIAEIDLNAKFPSRDYFQLIQPIVAAFNQSTPLLTDCEPGLTTKMSKKTTDKNETWLAFRCRETASLPDAFFETAPFIHDSGASYAFLAFQSGVAPYNTPTWVKKHIQFFHISELRLLPPESLDENLKIFSKLNETLYDALIQGRSPLLAEDYYLVRSADEKRHLYRVFSRLEFEKYLSDKSLFVKSATSNDQCYYLENNLCFKTNDTGILRRLRLSSLIIFGSSILILISVCLILYSRIRFQNLEEDRKKHALRVLTHELRTPVSNLLLQVESINKHSDLVDPKVLEGLLKIEGDVYRLKRLAEKSSSYLNAKDDNRLISLEPSLIPSINEFLTEVAADYKTKDLKYNLLSEDRSISLDVYWFHMCLKNLIENAFHHGTKPVTMNASFENNILTVSITDSGKTNLKNLESLLHSNLNSNPKNNPTAGLGMGLNLVKRIMTEMNGGLSLKMKPTTFSIWVRTKSD